MSEPESGHAPARREFLKRVGAAGLAVTLGGVDALAATAPLPAPAAPPAPATPAAPSDDATALAAILRKRFPDRLTPEQWEEVTRQLDQRLGSGKRLAGFVLANADEPDFAFKA